MPEINLREKIILITGIGGGIGNIFMHHLKNKSKYLITASRSSKEEIFGQFKDIKNLSHYSLDLTQEKNVNSLFDAIKEKQGRLDILINTVGGSLYSHKLEEFPLEEFKRVIEVNLTSAFMLTKEAINLMKLNKNGGNIVHLVSSSAKIISNNKAPYGVAKAALARLIQYAATEAADYKIKINGVSPSYVFTPRHEQEIANKSVSSGKTREEIIDNITKSQLITRTLRSEDLIPLLELLISTEVITGQIFNCTLGEVISY